VSRTSNYIKGLGTGYIATIATIVVGLWLTPFTLRFLDREEYAVFALASDLLMWLGLLDLGITAGLNAQAAQLSGKPDQERLNRLASTAFFTQNIIVAIVIIVGGGLALGFPHFFHVRPELHQTTTVLMAMLVLGTAINFSTKTFSSLLVANQQIHIDNLIKLLLLVIRTVLTVVLLLRGWGLYSLAVASLAATIVTSAMVVLRTFHLLPGLKIQRHLASWDVLKRMGSLGVWFSLGGVAGIVISSLDRVVAGKLISIESVATLSLTGRMYILSRTFLDQITNTARPMLGQLLGQNKLDAAFRAYNQMFILSTGIAVVATASVWVGNGAFVTRWVGPQNYGGWPLDLALALNLLANSWVLPNRAALAAGLFKVPQHALSRVGAAALCLPLSILLGLQFGLVGIVAATALAEVCVSCWYLPLLTAQMFRRSFWGFVRDDMRPIALAGLLVLPVAAGARFLAGHLGAGFLSAAICGSITFAWGLFLLWFLAFNTELRARLLAQATGLRTRFLGRPAFAKA
jgi:O-antigen/teichoic acid export membrane protein